MQGRSLALVTVFALSLPLCVLHAHAGRHDAPAGSLTRSALALPAKLENAPPVITIAEIADAQVGAAFDYLPLAHDADRDTLRFTAVNLPPWASLDATSGHISGTPGPRDEGVYESISITVADATHSVVTAPFSITVNPAGASNAALIENAAPVAGTGVASLQWEVPASKVDGEPLDDLAGYRILYGRNSSDLDQSVMIENPATTSYQLSSLASGIWYFAVVAVTASGLEGPPTTIASKSI